MMGSANLRQVSNSWHLNLESQNLGLVKDEVSLGISELEIWILESRKPRESIVF